MTNPVKLSDQKMADTPRACTESDWMQSQSYLIGHVTPQGDTIDAERLRELYWQARYAVSMLTQD